MGGEVGLDVKIGNFFYGIEGWMEVRGSKWKIYMGCKNELGFSFESVKEEMDKIVDYLVVFGSGGYYVNFIVVL